MNRTTNDNASTTQTEGPAPRRFLDISAVAAILDVTGPTVRALLASGELDGFQVGGRGLWRIERSDFDAYIRREKARAAAARQARS